MHSPATSHQPPYPGYPFPPSTATPRADFVRRRKWLKRSQVDGADDEGQPPLESTPSRSFVSAGDAMHVTAASAAAADDTRRSNTTTSARTAAKAFFSMLQDAARRRGAGLMSIPWDPISWGSVYTEHSTWLANTQVRRQCIATQRGAATYIHTEWLRLRLHICSPPLRPQVSDSASVRSHTGGEPQAKPCGCVQCHQPMLAAGHPRGL